MRYSFGKACRAVYARAADSSTIQKNSVENTTRIRNGMSLFGGHPVLLWLTPYAFVPSRVCCVLVFVVFVLLLFAEDHNNDLYQRDYNMEDCPLVDEDHRQGHVFGEDEDDDGNQSRDDADESPKALLVLFVLHNLFAVLIENHVAVFVFQRLLFLADIADEKEDGKEGRHDGEDQVDECPSARAETCERRCVICDVFTVCKRCFVIVDRFAYFAVIIAIAFSETVSIAAETMGMLRLMFRVKRAFVLTSRGKTSE